MRDAPYTVAHYVAEMEACGSSFEPSPNGACQDTRGVVDWDAFDSCRARAVEASITTRQVMEHLENEGSVKAEQAADWLRSLSVNDVPQPIVPALRKRFGLSVHGAIDAIRKARQ